MNMLDRIANGHAWQPRTLCGISLAPETYTEGGSLLDDVDVTLISLKFVTWDYGKADQKSAPFLKVDMQPDGTADIHSEYMRCGDLEHWAPSADGDTIEPQSPKARESGGINKGTNLALFLMSLVQSGVPSTKLAEGKVSALAGIRCHVLRVKQPKRSSDKADAKQPMVLTVSKLISTPWDGAVPQQPLSPVHAVAAKTAANAAGNGAAKFEPIVGPGGVVGDGELAMLVVSLLTARGGSMKRMEVMQEVFKAASAGAIPLDAKDAEGKPARTTAPAKVHSEAFLGSQPFWRYDGATVTLQ